MEAELLIVQICEFLDVGDGVHRFHGPSKALAALPGVVVIDVDLHHRLAPVLLERADVVILAGFDWDMLPMLKRRRETGRITVFEANDFYDDIQPWNPLAARWMDRSVRDSFTHGLIHADAVQTSTRALARRWRMRTDKPIAVFENQLSGVPPLPPPRTQERPLTIGWGGSPGHFADWHDLAPTLQHWLEAHPACHLAVMNNEFAKPFIRLPEERYHFYGFASLARYLEFVQTLDIGLAPLLPSEYNRCRSDVKFLEYASRGVAGIYADLEPYRDSVVHGQTGLIYRDHEELTACLDRLADDSELRRAIGRGAYDYVTRERRLEDHVVKRLEFYCSLMPASRSSPGQQVPPDVLAAATIDGRYLQLRAGKPETALRSGIDGPAESAVATLKQLVGEHPDYLPALQHLGRRLNDRRKCHDAIAVLEKALTLDQLSARTLAELGRSWYLLDDEPKARALMEQAVKINPCYPSAWQYLLVLLHRTGAADGLRWAKLARQANPANFALALLAAKLYPPLEMIGLLGELLATYQGTFLPEEVPLAGAAFAQAIAPVVTQRLASSEAIALLEAASKVFPCSAMLAALLGEACYLAGAIDRSRASYRRFEEIRQTARAWNAEYPTEDGTIHFGQFAQHVAEVGKSQENPSDRGVLE